MGNLTDMILDIALPWIKYFDRVLFLTRNHPAVCMVISAISLELPQFVRDDA
jgi:hypothetical protein